MDEQRFDALTRALARGSSRRTAIKGLFGGLVGGVAVATRLDLARAGVQEDCDCVAVPCKSLRCDGGNCIYTDLCTDPCTVCNTNTGACDPKVCSDPCDMCIQGECTPKCGNGVCCGGECKQCCSTDDCFQDPFYVDQCGEIICNDAGACEPRTTCLVGEQCCNSGTADHYCATCCDDDGCLSCQSCIDGTCVDDECCGNSDCYGKCASCVEGTCVSNCDTDEYCCARTNGCLANGKCCNDDECPCGYCSEGTCYSECTDEQKCCGSGDERVCAECCSGNDCTEKPCGSCHRGICEYNACCYPDHPCTEPCHICSTSGCINTCKTNEECCGESCVAIGTCCRETGDTCAVTDGPGTQGNCCEDLLCCATGEGGACQECCHDDDCEGCSFCNQGVCTDHCVEGRRCCDGDCIPDDECCSVDPECPPNHFCCGKGEAGAHCAFCCEDSQCEGDFGYCEDGHCYLGQCHKDSDCPGCSHCTDHMCYGECSQSQECCHGVCVDDDACCRSEGSTCGVTPVDDSAQVDCCDGLVCCDNLYYGASVCAECCVDHDCRHGGHCHNGECTYPHVCKDDRGCPAGTCCCDDGSCSGKCCHHPHPHPKPQPTPPDTVTTLPATGAGPNDERNDLLGVLGLGAAAALFAAKQLRDDPEQSEQVAEN